MYLPMRSAAHSQCHQLAVLSLKDIKELTTYWKKVFPLRPGVVDAISIPPKKIPTKNKRSMDVQYTPKNLLIVLFLTFLLV